LERIAIIGCGGSGKSTLAREMGRVLSLPVYHLDRLYWRAGWVETPEAEWRAIQAEIVNEPKWIIDGNYGGSMEIRLERADTIVFLDLPTWTCLAGALQRYRRFRGRTRPELADGCPERLTFDYLAWIWRYRKRRRPRILKRLQGVETSKTVVSLSTRSNVDWFVSGLSGRTS
jgi:adenylate kinase family enzyme